MEIEETCLAGDESTHEEAEKLNAPKLVFCRGHCDQLVSRSTFYCHRSERHDSSVDSEEEEFASISERCPSKSFLDEPLPVLELRELTTQQHDTAHNTSMDEVNDMDHSPCYGDTESVSSF